MFIVQPSSTLRAHNIYQEREYGGWSQTECLFYALHNHAVADKALLRDEACDCSCGHYICIVQHNPLGQ